MRKGDSHGRPDRSRVDGVPCRGRATGGREPAPYSLAETVARLKQFSSVALGGILGLGGWAPAGPRMAEIGISDFCDHGCVFCREDSARSRDQAGTASAIPFGGHPPGEMSLPLFCRLVDDLYRAGTRRLDIAGRGEPLLHPQALPMISYAKERGMNVKLYTNGALLGGRHAEAFLATRLDVLSISLNAGRPETFSRVHRGRCGSDLLAVLDNARHLAERKRAIPSPLPFLQLSFNLVANNADEIVDMVQAAAAAGAQEASFDYAILQESMRELQLSLQQLRALREKIPPATALARAHGIKTNLDSLLHRGPYYLREEVPGPAIVPCYMGWYYTFVIGNGSTLLCSQRLDPIDQVTESQSFAQIWNSPAYRRHRLSARALPRADTHFAYSDCHRCCWRGMNLSIHNFLRPWRRLDGDPEGHRISAAGVLRRLRADRPLGFGR